MAQFNLINTGTIKSNTVSGTGTLSLSNDELRALYDGNTTSSGVSVLNTDILYLDIDMGFRVRLDDVNLFITVPGDRATALNNVNFYYKNSASDNYTLCAKSYDTEKFFVTGLTGLFAPRYVRITITNQEAEIYETELLNDDTQVSFGEDGNETLVILNQTLNGYDELGIFNNSPIGTQTVNAYVMVDYQGLASDYYIKLCDTYDGEFLGLIDGVDLKNNDLSQTYTWQMGTLENITTDANGYLVNSNVSDGYYTTPLFDMFDKLNNTFLMVEHTTSSGASLTYDDSAQTETMLMRSSDNYPLPFNKMFWTWKDSSTSRAYIFVGDMTSNYIDSTYYNIWTDANAQPVQIKFDRKKAKVYVLYKETDVSPNNYRVRRYDYLNKVGEDYSSYSSLNNMSTNWDIDSEGRVWGYVKQSGFRLVQFSYDLQTRTTIKEDTQSDFLGDLSADKEYPSCWFTDKKQNKLEHIDYEGNLIVSIGVADPSYVTSLPDGGCFVVSASESKLLQYSYYGTEQRSISFDSSLVVTDLSYGVHSDKQPFSSEVLWIVLNNTRILQINFSGEVVSEVTLSSVDTIEAFPGGCMAYSQAEDKAYQLNDDGQVAYIWSLSSYSNGATTIPFPVSIYYEEYLELNDITNVLPLPNDPYWGTSSGWQETPLVGQKLPMFRYHQFKLKFNPLIYEIPLTNPGAESGDISGWTDVYGLTASTSYSHSGTYGFSCARNSGQSSYQIHGYQRIDLNTVPIDLVVGKTMFYARAYQRRVNTSNTVSHKFGVGIQFRDDDAVPNVIYTHYGPTLTTNSNSWFLNIDSSALVAGARYVEIFTWSIYTDNYNNMYSDDFELYAFNSAELQKVLIPQPVIIKDIKPQEFKNIYIKTDIPADAEYKEYETRLKCWWGSEDI